MRESDKHSLFGICFLMLVLFFLAFCFMWGPCHCTWPILQVLLIIWMVVRLFMIRPWEYREERRGPVAARPRNYTPNAAYYIS
jgi:preprotein translocase subunit YajC